MKKYLIILLLMPASLSAQSRTVVSAYVASDGGVDGNPLLVGGTYAKERGPVAARLSMGFDVSEPIAASTDPLAPTTNGIMGSDADVLLYLGDPRGGQTIIPFGVAGAGFRALRHADDLGLAANYSYGGGFRAPLGSGFAMEGEARYRNYFHAPEGPSGPAVKNGMEFRFGLNVGFGGGPSVRRPGLRGPVAIPAGTRVVTADARMRVAAATLSSGERYLGVPYLWGGNTPDTGFDCSGFIRYVFAQNGISLPRVSVDQARFGYALPLEIRAFEPGDILAFSSDGRTVDHTAIYAGNGRILHSSSSGNGVRYDDLGSQRGRWFLDHLVAARRVIDAGYFAS